MVEVYVILYSESKLARELAMNLIVIVEALNIL